MQTCRSPLACCFAVALLAGCESSKVPDVPDDFGPYGNRSIEDTTATPSHRMSQREYPFTSSGRYVREWAYSGESRYTGPEPEEEPVIAPQPDPRPISTPSRQSPSGPTTPYPTPPPRSAPAAKPRPPVSSAYRYHTVQSGETLWRISQKHGVTVSSIVRANNLKNYIIVPGQRLKIQK